MARKLTEIDESQANNTRATRAPGERRYPVSPMEVRAVAVQRIRYRDWRRMAAEPSEYAVWLEFFEFPEVLGEYVPVQGASAAQTRAFAEQWVMAQEREDRRVYGEVRFEISDRIDLLLRSLGGERPRPDSPQLTLSHGQRLAAWDRQIEVARQEGCGEDSKRMKFLRRGRERMAKRGADEDALAEVFD